MSASEKSTNVRFIVLRSGMAALAAVSPGLAARAGERLFLSPPRHPPPARERAELSGVERLAFRHRGGALHGWRMGAGPAVLLVHGWGGRSGQLAPLGRALAQAGLSAVAFDGPAHGASDGWAASVPHFADAVAEVAGRTGAVAAVGHSMGGAAVALAAIRGLPLGAAVTVGTPRAPAAWLEQFSSSLALGPRVREALRERLERRVGARMADLDLPRLAALRADVPLLVVHDRGDREVPFEDGAAVAAAWPGARLHATEGLGHRRILRDAAVIEAVAAFLSAELPRCGSCGRLAARLGPAPRCDGCELAAELWERDGRGSGRAGSA
jgi:pimeloyl-ACP methyl ester carboxylesterase